MILFVYFFLNDTAHAVIEKAKKNKVNTTNNKIGIGLNADLISIYSIKKLTKLSTIPIIDNAFIF
jgi:hypothetical protein